MTKYAQESKLFLKTKIGQNQKCIIEDALFTPPLKLMSPFYEENNMANIMLLSVSAGLMEGDSQQMEFIIGKDCKVKLTSQSFEKIHDTQQGYASREMQIKLEENALLDFSPLPIIPFKNSHFKGNTKIYLSQNSQLVYGEIISAGRVAQEEIFEFKRFSNTLKIHRENKPIFFDNTLLEPKTLDLNNMCMFGGFTHYLNLIVLSPPMSIESLLGLIESFGLNGGVSELANEGLCLKALDNGSETLLKLREEVSKLL